MERFRALQLHQTKTGHRRKATRVPPPRLGTQVPELVTSGNSWHESERIWVSTPTAHRHTPHIPFALGTGIQREHRLRLHDGGSRPVDFDHWLHQLYQPY